jgi:hypothetical protein
MIKTEQGITVTYGGVPITNRNLAPNADIWNRYAEVKIDDQLLRNWFVVVGYPQVVDCDFDEDDYSVSDCIRVRKTDDDTGPYVDGWTRRYPSGTPLELGNQLMSFTGHQGIRSNDHDLLDGVTLAGVPQIGSPDAESVLIRAGFPFPISQNWWGLWWVFEGCWRLGYIRTSDGLHPFGLDLARGQSPLVELTYRPGKEKSDWTIQPDSCEVLPGYALDFSRVTAKYPGAHGNDGIWKDKVMDQLTIVRA